METLVMHRRRKIILLIASLFIMVVATAALNFYLQYKRQQISAGKAPGAEVFASVNTPSADPARHAALPSSHRPGIGPGFDQ